MNEIRTVEPELPPEVAARSKGLRTGWTTGTCATAASKAAAMGLRDGTAPAEVEVTLLSGVSVRFAVEAGPDDVPNERVVVKDAGDDPDCTHGARVTARVEWAIGDRADTRTGSPDGTPTPTQASSAPPPVTLRAGSGVGVVTKLGLGLAVGDPAINPVPRRMIGAALAEVVGDPVVVTISVPGGEAMAAKTTNERLGIIGGISILGTTGVVRPFSTAAYRASVVQQIDVAAAQGESTIVLATGSRSERHAMAALPELSEVCFIEVGDFTGIALRRAAASGVVRRIVFVGMAGKLAKLAAGVMMTHFHRSKVDTELLAKVARECDAPPRVIAAATETETARHFFEVCDELGFTAPLLRVCELAAQACQSHVEGALEVEVRMVDFDGDREIARAEVSMTPSSAGDESSDVR